MKITTSCYSNMARNGRRSNVRSRNGRNARGRGMQRIPPTVRAKFDGRKLKPNYDPPSVVENRWNSIVLVLEGHGTGSVPVSELITDIQDVYGFTLKTNVYMLLRVQRAYVWETTGESGLNVEFNDLSYPFTDNMPFRPLVTVSDEPAKNHYACVGYEWPAAQQQVVYNSQGQLSAELINVTATSTSPELLIHIHLLWKTNIGGVASKGEIFHLRSRRMNETESVGDHYSDLEGDSGDEP